MRYLVLLLVVLCTSCTSTVPSLKPYHLDVQQGNVVTSKMMLQLKPGMTKSQVRYVMGTPLLQDSFHPDRWDYIYQMNKGGQTLERRRVILEFKDDGLASVRGDVIAAGTPGAGDAPMANIDDVKSAKSDKTLLNEDPKTGWFDRFKFWADDDKKQSAGVQLVQAKPKAEPEKGWLDSLKFWEDKEKPVAPVVAAKAESATAIEPKAAAVKAEAVKVEDVKVEAPKVEQAAPLSLAEAQEPVTAPASESPKVVEAVQQVAEVQPQQKAADTPVTADAKTEITAMVDAWAEAWRTKNLDAYLQHYSAQFVPDSGTRKTWLAQRKQRIADQAGAISLKLEGVKIEADANRARVEFLQHYSNGKLNDHMNKVLSLSKEQNHWLIVKESSATKSPKAQVDDGLPVVEVFKLRDVTADEKSEAMPEEMIQESAKKAQEPAPVVKPAEPVNPAPVKAEPAPAKVESVKPEPVKVAPAKVAPAAEPAKVESNKDKPLPPEDAPGYFERMLEKIGF